MSRAPSDVEITPDLRQRQGVASNPELSAWVSANAGAGKTYVLTRRVTRLLLGGSDPSRILCLTYTKAAAANMATRVFGALEAWAQADDTTLRGVLKDFIADPTARDLAHARRLFARAIETPGGLRVQTIHAFCQGLLQAFPFEANVPANFSVMDGVQTRDLLKAARDDVMGSLDDAFDPRLAPYADALHDLAMTSAPGTLAGHLDAAVNERRALLKWLGREDSGARLVQRLALDPQDDRNRLAADLLISPHAPADLWLPMAEALDAGSASLRQVAAKLRRMAAAEGEAMLGAYLDTFLTQGGTPRASLATKAFARDHPDWAARLDAEIARAVAIKARADALALFERSRALFTLAEGVIERFEAAKRRRGLMEFQDLIDRAAGLLSPEGNRWVLFKLDGGLDHVLLDEAQDTSPAQWDIIRHLTEAFHGAEAGASMAEGGDGRMRTVFAVGDPKQSIFSFQGAQPKRVGEERDALGGQASRAGYRFEEVAIDTSFRSAPNILAAVDAVFAPEDMHGDLEGIAGTGRPHHVSARPKARSAVELWAPVFPVPAPEERPWDAPLDTPSPTSPHERLARRIATRIKGLIDKGLPAGEVLVLVRKRDKAFEAVIRALRDARVPVAGADRLKLLEQIAILDLLALADFVLLPDDDLTLATLLKSPLIDFGDAATDAETRLMHLAHGRDGRLWNALRDAAATDPVCERAVERLEDWIGLGAYARPFEFFAHVLGAGRARRAFLARLGSEAGDAIDAFLSLALAYEERHPPTLQGFAHDVRATEREVSRELSEAAGAVRVMTVHNAKGLEAEAVFLVCGGQKVFSTRHDADIMTLGDEEGAPLVYAPSARSDPPAVARVREAARLARAAEERRLLYVAMTRARDWLYVCACRNSGEAGDGPALIPDAETWHGMIARALGEGAESLGGGEGEPAWVWPKGARAEPERGAVDAGPPETVAPPPAWLARDADEAAPEPERAASAVPHPAGAARRTGTGKEAATRSADPLAALDPLRRGTLVHALLERLPDVEPSRREAAARAHCARAARDLDGALHDALVAEAAAVLAHPDLEAVFSHGRAEVDIIGRLTRGRETFLVEGRIDRLAVLPGRVLLIDFKTDRPAPAAPEDVGPGYVAQLAAYRDLLAQAYPEHAIEALLVWTAEARVMPLPDAVLDDAAGLGGASEAA